MNDLLQNVIMTVILFPVSMILVGIYMWISGPYSRKMFWWVVIVAYLIMLIVCWGVETGLLYKIIQR